MCAIGVFADVFDLADGRYGKALFRRSFDKKIPLYCPDWPPNVGKRRIGEQCDNGRTWLRPVDNQESKKGND